MKKTVIALLFCALSVGVFAQEEESSSFYQGLWIETSSNNTFLIRDIANGEKAGFEFDRAAIYTKANWWFWADFASKFQLDAEIGIWELDLPLYQANSFGGNVPDTTWTDGFQGLLSVLFAPLFGLNRQNVGGFNKMGFGITSPFVKARFGYGLLKDGGMSEFTGIYNVIYRWDDVGRGYTELHLGDKLTKIGDNATLNFFAGLSRMRAEYGVYSLATASFFDKVDLAASFTSTTNSGELFRYNEQNENAYSLYASWKVLDSLRFSVHGLSSFGTGIVGGFVASSAIALGAAYKTGIWAGDLTLSIAGRDSRTVWGDDDTLVPDSLSAYLVQWFTVNDTFKIGLDTKASFFNTAQFSDGLINIRNQPMLDLSFEKLGTLSLYGVLQLDRIALLDDLKQPWAFWFEEAGLEFTWNEIPFMKKIVFDYAVLMEYTDWNKGYDFNIMYNSVMLSGEINDKLSATIGSIIRVGSLSPPGSMLGLAFGASIKTDWKFGAPRFWAHIAYGMDPYEDNNYTLYRADDPLNDPVYRTYMLKTLNEFTDKCRISIGLIWEL